MVNPIEQQQPSMAYDSARTQIMPPVIAEPTPQPTLQSVPLKAADTSQYDYEQDNRRGSQGDTADENRQQAAAAQVLRQAWQALDQLRSLAKQAQDQHDTQAARKVAQDAADISVQIRRIARQVPINDALNEVAILQQVFSYIPVMPVVITPAPATDDGDTDADTSGDDASADARSTASSSVSAPSDLAASASAASSSSSQTACAAYDTSDRYAGQRPDKAPAAPDSPLALARGGLGVAKEVVDTAASLPNLNEQDTESISLSLSRVLDSMAAVENWAGQGDYQTDSQGEVVGDPVKLDIQA